MTRRPASWPAWSGVSFSNPKGRTVLACTGSAAGTCTSPQTAVAYSYDQVGRTKDFWQCNSTADCSSVRDTHYNYDVGGDVTSWIHPEGFTLTNAINTAQQITSITSSLTGTDQPQYLAQSISYTAWGAVSQLVNGCAGSGCVNGQETYIYNKRLQPWTIEVGTTANASAYYCLVYNYFTGSWTPPSSCPRHERYGPDGDNRQRQLHGLLVPT